MITLLNFFTFAEEDGGSGFYTPWMQFPANHQVAEYWIDCKSYYIGGANLTLESSIDGDAVQTVDGPTSITAAGLTRTEVNDKLAPLVRLKVVQDGVGAGGILTLSVWLVPKIGG